MLFVGMCPQVCASFANNSGILRPCGKNPLFSLSFFCIKKPGDKKGLASTLDVCCVSVWVLSVLGFDKDPEVGTK